MKNLVLIWCLILVFASCKHRKQEEQLASNEYYTCSMDVQVREKQPGPCPICHMQMIKVTISQDDKNKLHLSAEQIRLANIRVDTVRVGAISDEISVAAKTSYDENLTSVVSSRVAGRIDRLQIRATGELVHKGDLLYEIYSEQLAAAESDYLVALDEVSQQITAGINYQHILDAAKNKLLLWGLTEKQIQAIASKKEVSILTPVYNKEDGVITETRVKEGDYVKEGQVVYKLNTLSSVWIELQLYAGEDKKIYNGKTVKIKFYDYPDKALTGKISFISPEIVPGSKVNPVRIELLNPDYLLKPGMSVSANIETGGKRGIALPLNAVLQDSEGSSVWIQNADGTFESRMVHTGIRNSDFIEILHGLTDGEKVVISGAYLLQSEYQFKKGSNPMEGMKM